MEYWDITENPVDEIYRKLIKVLCNNSDKLYFVTREELKYNQEILEQFKPYTIESYKTKEWANTMAKGPAATVYVVESSAETCRLLQQFANTLYDWVAPKLPEDLTFIKNNFEWFSCTTHEEFGGFSIRSDYYRNLMGEIHGLKIQKIE
jgi:ribosomal protein L10